MCERDDGVLGRNGRPGLHQPADLSDRCVIQADDIGYHQPNPLAAVVQNQRTSIAELG